jgi:hypothetical protein
VTPAPAFVEARVRAEDRPCARGVTIVLGAGGPGARRILVGPGFDHRLLLEVIGTLERDHTAAEPTP